MSAEGFGVVLHYISPISYLYPQNNDYSTMNAPL